MRRGLAWAWIALLLGCGSATPSKTIRLQNLTWSVFSSDTTLSPVPARVPGHVLPDLVEAGLAPDPYLETHEIEVQWVESLSWTYRTHLDLPRGWESPSQVQLEFAGLDTYAHVWVDGREILSSDNAHRTWVTLPFELGPAGVDIDVLFDPVAPRGQILLDAHAPPVPAGNEMRPVGQQTSPFTRKAGYQFGWDWGPRLAGPGIVGEVSLKQVATGPTPSLPWCEVLSTDETEAVLVVHDGKDWELRMSRDGSPVAALRDQDTIRIASPALWWPAHMGPQPLYDVRWEHSRSGHIVEHRLGLRTAEWREDADTWGRSFALHINGTPVSSRGANVIPPDFHDAYSCEGWTSLVDQALSANMNMVRVWGGGVYPPDCFFEACDRHGLLVWQDFMFACSMVPGDSAFAQNVRAEAQQHVHRLHHRPSLVLWCGNNEVERAWESWGWQDTYHLTHQDSVNLVEAYREVFYEMLPDVVQQHASTSYLPTSPTLDPASGDEHAWGVWFGLESFDYYSRHAGRFASEYGLQSLPDRHTLQEAGIEHWSDDALQFRQRSKMEWLEPGFDGWDMMHHFMAKTTGAPEVGDLEDWIFRSQATQAEGLRQALERHRTSQGRYAGSLYWSLNDVWPAVSWSTVDHAGRWKLGHYAAMRANKALTAQWQREREDSVTWVVFNDGPTAFRGSLVAEERAMDGTVLNRASTPLRLGAHSEFAWPAAEVGTWGEAPETTYLAWSLLDETGRVLERSTALWKAAVESNLAPCDVKCERNERGWTVTASSYAPVVYLTCSVPGHFSDNGMSLEAGTPVEVSFTPELETTEALDVQARVLNPIR